MEFLNSIFLAEGGSASNIGYIVVLVITLLETTPIGGILVPGQTVLMLAGVMAKFGFLNFWILTLIASTGAILGDYVGYLIGKKYGNKFLKKFGKKLFIKDEQVEKTKKLMQTHSGKTLIIGRFNSFTRSFAPLIAGISNIKPRKFIIYEILSGLIWAIFYGGVGFVFGQSYEMASKYIGHITAIGFGIIIFGIVAYYLINKKRHIYEKFHIKILTINIIAFYTFFKITDNVLKGGKFLEIDGFIAKTVDLIRSPFMTKIIDFVGFASSIYVFLAVIVALLFVLLKQKKHESIGLFVVSLGFITLATHLLKEVVARLRPTEALIAVSGFSFPSMHSAFSAGFFLFIIYAFRRKFSLWYTKGLFILVNVFFILLIGFSRLYFNVHYFSDVIAGFSLGVSSVAFFVLAFKFVMSQIQSWKSLKK